MSNLLIPNSTQLPNVLLDNLMPVLAPTDWKLVCFVARKTYGWQKQEDRISLSQFQAGTGISRKWVSERLTVLTEIGLLRKIETTSASLWALNLDFDAAQLVASGYQCTQATSSLSTPKLVASVPIASSPTLPTKQTNKTKKPNSDISLAVAQPFNATDVAQIVCVEIGAAGDRLAKEAIRLVVQAEFDVSSSVVETTSQLIAAGQAYKLSRQYSSDFRRSWEKFYGSGQWRDALSSAESEKAREPTGAEVMAEEIRRHEERKRRQGIQ